MSEIEGISVLVVDDSTVIRRRVRQLMEKEPRIVRLFEAGDAAEGYSLFKICRPDVVVLDLELPDLSGLDVLKSIKEAARSSVVIILTTYREPEIRNECLRRGASAFLSKDSGLLTIAETVVELATNVKNMRVMGET
jgi:DNA-binding NarL/FixJ family response regulator